ncbi:UNVERIFIED_CONTAM: hypothetical protein Sradi_4408500 [Sesamum radiatum]|uniref:Integrase zinc-binding domain-containing protein n=1 Tax=Sesamum radiatum TaxID=300843 RepID=A0AAW2NQJ2_SESRA
MIQRFDKCMVHQIPREENGRADALSKFGAMVFGIKETKVPVPERMQFKANRFIVIGDELFKRTPEGMLNCLDNECVKYVMKEIHGGSCGNHSGGRSLAQKITRQGYFWPTMVTDAMEFSKKMRKLLEVRKPPAHPSDPYGGNKNCLPIRPMWDRHCWTLPLGSSTKEIHDSSN